MGTVHFAQPATKWICGLEPVENEFSSRIHADIMAYRHYVSDNVSGLFSRQWVWACLNTAISVESLIRNHWVWVWPIFSKGHILRMGEAKKLTAPLTFDEVIPNSAFHQTPIQELTFFNGWQFNRLQMVRVYAIGFATQRSPSKKKQS